jgi:hypothetical protein
MEIFLPSLLIVILGLGVVVGIFPRLTPFFLVIIALVLLVLAAYNHYTLFGADYRIQTWLSWGSSFAPIILIGTVVLFSGGYLLYLMGRGGAGSANLPRNAYSPVAPPETATNVVTESIGRAIGNTPTSYNRKELVSKNRSLNITSAEERNVAAERLA